MGRRTWLKRKRPRSSASPEDDGAEADSADDEADTEYDPPATPRERPIWDPGPEYPADDLLGGYPGLSGDDPGADPRDVSPGGDSPELQGTGVSRDGAASADGASAEGEAPPRPRRLRLADLAAGSPAAAWKRRAVIAAVAGVAFGVFFDWRAGLTAAVLAAIADTVYRARRAAAAPRTSRMTVAQRRTRRQITRLERVGYRALHSCAIPGSGELIDHLVVGPTGVYAIDSEDWDKRLPVSTKSARQLFHGPYSQKDRLAHARWEARQASQRLAAELGDEIPVRPAMAVYGPRIPWIVLSIRDVDVFSGGRVRKYLRKNPRVKGKPRLSRPEIDRIHEAAARVLPDSGLRSALG